MYDLSTKYKFFKEWLNNGGKDNPLPPNLAVSIEKLEFDANGDPKPESVSPVLNSAMLAILGSHFSNPYQLQGNLSEYQSLLQKDFYFEQYSILTEEDFEKFYTEFYESNKIIFRGVPEAKWRLYNSLQRHWIKTEKKNNLEKYKSYVKSLTDNARIENNDLLKKFLRKNNINPDNDVAILSFLQHYGCPTPMLDWTYNLDCALFFATENVTTTGRKEIDEFISIYFLEEEHIKETSLRIITENVLKSYEEKIQKETIENGKKEGITKEEISKFFSPVRLALTAKMLYGKLAITGACRVDSIFMNPMSYFSDVDEDVVDLIPFSLNNNLNVVNQNGIFIFSNHPVNSLEEVGVNSHVEDGGDRDVYRFCKCYNIHKTLVPHILQKLESMGVNYESIYPNPVKLVGSVFENTEKNIG